MSRLKTVTTSIASATDGHGQFTVPPPQVLTLKSMGSIHVGKNLHNCLCNLPVSVFTASWDSTDAGISSSTSTPCKGAFCYSLPYSICHSLWCEGQKTVYGTRNISLVSRHVSYIKRAAHVQTLEY